jgi:hypothetical protein
MRDFEYTYRPGAELDLLAQGEVLWSYRFGTDREKPYIHPLLTPSGLPLTAFEPWDHPWQRGLWFSWHMINGVDYWDEGPAVPRGVEQGSLVFIGPEVVTMGPKRAKVVSHYEYRSQSEGLVLLEVRTIRFRPPREGRYTIDFDLAYTAKRTVTISSSPSDSSGFTGIGMRLARTLGKLRVQNSEGQEGEDTYHQPARWVDITGVSDGGWDRAGGVALLEHPQNLRAPHKWVTDCREGMGFMNPSLAMEEPIELEPGDGIALRYRVLVHDGEMSHGELEEAYHEFTW